MVHIDTQRLNDVIMEGSRGEDTQINELPLSIMTQAETPVLKIGSTAEVEEGKHL